MPDVVTFGEAMIRLAPPHFQRLEQTATLGRPGGWRGVERRGGCRSIGFDERLGLPTPKNSLGRIAENRARQADVDTSHLVWTADAESRMGLYFLEFGAAPRASAVLYDRRNSAISAIRPGEVDWKRVMEGARWFHTSGITPALSDTAAAVTREALQAAKQAGLTVSYDLNYRGKLWTPQKAQAVQEPLMEYVDVLITTEEDTNVVFNINAKARTGEKTDSQKSPPSHTKKSLNAYRKNSVSRPWRSLCVRTRWCGATPGRPSRTRKASSMAM